MTKISGRQRAERQAARRVPAPTVSTSSTPVNTTSDATVAIAKPRNHAGRFGPKRGSCHRQSEQRRATVRDP